MALRAKELSLKGLILPEENAPEAAVVRGVSVFGIKTLSEVIDFLRDDKLQIPFGVDIHKAMEENSIFAFFTPLECPV
jgi:magnesium chelatase family protein